jgi:hypothetical protein
VFLLLIFIFFIMTTVALSYSFSSHSDDCLNSNHLLLKKTLKFPDAHLSDRKKIYIYIYIVLKKWLEYNRMITHCSAVFVSVKGKRGIRRGRDFGDWKEKKTGRTQEGRTGRKGSKKREEKGEVGEGRTAEERRLQASLHSTHVPLLHSHCPRPLTNSSPPPLLRGMEPKAPNTHCGRSIQSTQTRSRRRWISTFAHNLATNSHPSPARQMPSKTHSGHSRHVFVRN